MGSQDIEYGTRYGDVTFDITMPPVVEASTKAALRPFEAWLLEPYAWNELGGQASFAQLESDLEQGAPLAAQSLQDYTLELEARAFASFNTYQAKLEVPLAPIFMVVREHERIFAADLNPMKLVPPVFAKDFSGQQPTTN